MLPSMRYKSFTWPHNPRLFELEYARRIKIVKLPFAGCVVQDMGRELRVIKGEGEFVGVDACVQFLRLAELFKSGGVGVLCHPLLPPVNAYFTKLSLKEEPRDNYLSYSFEFLEYGDGTVTNSDSAITNVTEAKFGDTLGKIAAAYNTDVSTLMKLNKNIKNPNELSAGQTIILP